MAETHYRFPFGQPVSGNPLSRRRAPHFSVRTIRDFTESIALLTHAGLTVRDALSIAATVFPGGSGERGEPRRLAELLFEQIKAGSAFSDALCSLGGSFPPLYRGLVRVGERVGTLELVLSRIASYLADEKRVR
ncbi:MAG TPA: type II secretion system F family protein, partial [Spirochaetia bacterium]|nr:type II secretion system F family protein [Spirochaetia bacterium]